MRNVRIREENHGFCRIWRVRLKNDLAPSEEDPDAGGVADAVRVRFNGAAWEDTTEALTVYDPSALVRALTDDLQWVKYCHDSKRWEIIGPGGRASETWSEIEFAVAADFDYSAATFSVTVTKVKGQPVVALGATITVKNPVGTVNAHWFYGCTGMRGWATYDGGADPPAFDARGVECDPSCTPAPE